MAIAKGAADGSIPDYQLSAWLMAEYLNPLNADETAWLTLAMADSGERLDLTGLPKPWVDKHSTGGVGDKTSIVLLPILACCGLTIVKMSGRGLGITGGTVDKLASIPGLRLDLSPQQLKDEALKLGLAPNRPNAESGACRQSVVRPAGRYGDRKLNPLDLIQHPQQEACGRRRDGRNST